MSVSLGDASEYDGTPSAGYRHSDRRADGRDLLGLPAGNVDARMPAADRKRFGPVTFSLFEAAK